MVRTLVLTTALLLALPAMLPAQTIPKQPPPVASPMIGQSDAKERAACRPDVVRYCKELIKDDNNSDVFAILGCLQSNRTRISKACNEVLASHGQ